MNKFTTSLIAGFVAQAISGYASATTLNEMEVNDPIQQAQSLTASTATQIQINGVIGQLGGAVTNDADFFEFYAQAGDVLDLNIENGIGGSQDVDTTMGVYDENGNLLDQNDDEDFDNGIYDSRVENFVVPATGRYIVAVSNWPHNFKAGGAVWYPTDMDLPGDYNLVITNSAAAPAAPSVTPINIEVKPGQRGGEAPINPKSRGKIPVALLSSQTFKPMNVDTSTLRFGQSGTEDSLSKCNKFGTDLNGDGFMDLICHFNNQDAGFDYNTLVGVVTGQAKVDGQTVSFRREAPLKVVPRDYK